LAPFGGRAADVLVQPGDQVAPAEEICTLIDPASLEAEFSLLEQEIAGLTEQRSVFITPVAQPDLRLRARLDIINPRVDAGGLLRVRARLIDRPKHLYPGMNVTVTLGGKAPLAVLLPKSAVVLRSGRTLVFAYDEPSGLAKWQYVTVAAENDELVAILEGVEAGQRVVVAGGLTLDHDSPVRVE
jgi:RND family efflux transporter MFP subunit